MNGQFSENAVELANLILDGEVDPTELHNHATANKDKRPSYDDLSKRLANLDDRADQDKAKAAARSFLKNRPKAQVIGDQTTIGM